MPESQLAQARRARALALRNVTRDFMNAIEATLDLDGVDDIMIDRCWLSAKMTDDLVLDGPSASGGRIDRHG